MHDPETSEWLRPGVVRKRLLDELGRLPPDEHLRALDAVDRHEVEIILTSRTIITIVVGERWHISLPVRDVILDIDDRADAEADGA